MFELLPTTQANSVLPVELLDCFTTAPNVGMHEFQDLKIDATASLVFNALPSNKFTFELVANLGADEVAPKKFTFDATANLGLDEVAPRPR